MTHFWNARVTSGEWLVHHPQTLRQEGFEPLLVCRERSRRGTTHLHMILSHPSDTAKTKDKLNKTMRKAWGLTFEEHPMGVWSAPVEDLEKTVSYNAKDGEILYVVEQLAQQALAAHHPEPDEESTSSAPKKSRFSMLDHMEQTWEMHIHTEGELELFANNRRAFGQRMVEYLGQNHTPQFRVSNFNTFWAYIATLHWRLWPSQGGQAIVNSMPSWM